jgi:hypothetical protein
MENACQLEVPAAEDLPEVVKCLEWAGISKDQQVEPAVIGLRGRYKWKPKGISWRVE